MPLYGPHPNRINSNGNELNKLNKSFNKQSLFIEESKTSNGDDVDKMLNNVIENLTNFKPSDSINEIMPGKSRSRKQIVYEEVPPTAHKNFLQRKDNNCSYFHRIQSSQPELERKNRILNKTEQEMFIPIDVESSTTNRRQNILSPNTKMSTPVITRQMRHEQQQNEQLNDDNGQQLFVPTLPQNRLQRHQSAHDRSNTNVYCNYPENMNNHYYQLTSPDVNMTKMNSVSTNRQPNQTTSKMRKSIMKSEKAAKSHNQSTSSSNRKMKQCIVLYNYVPKNDQEMELLFGDIINIIEFIDNEKKWAYGATISSSNRSGIFPLNHVQLIDRPLDINYLDANDRPSNESTCQYPKCHTDTETAKINKPANNRRENRNNFNYTQQHLYDRKPMQTQPKSIHHDSYRNTDQYRRSLHNSNYAGKEPEEMGNCRVRSNISPFNERFSNQAVAIFNFEAKTTYELPLQEGDLVEITRTIDCNWSEGRKILDNSPQVGIFPTSYVRFIKR
ncbi:hypothetical protein SNEBB_008649 [Seison nebaliae]|nr:hypothetical protein SNEBB_008649 [Seison nebaliae]